MIGKNKRSLYFKGGSKGYFRGLWIANICSREMWDDWVLSGETWFKFIAVIGSNCCLGNENLLRTKTRRVAKNAKGKRAMF
jgi:hypothetical protein